MDDNTSNVIYFFDEYEDIDVEISKEDFDQCVSFINEWKGLIPDNDELLLGDDEWKEQLPNEIPWKKNI